MSLIIQSGFRCIDYLVIQGVGLSFMRGIGIPSIDERSIEAYHLSILQDQA